MPLPIFVDYVAYVIERDHKEENTQIHYTNDEFVNNR